MEPIYQRLVVPVDGSASDERVLTVVRLLADRQPLSVTLVFVVEVIQSMPLDAEIPDEIARGEQALRTAEQMIRTISGKPCTVYTELLQARSTGAAIVDESIERAADAIVMAATIRKSHGKTTVGDTVGYVLKNAPCEVVIVRLPPGERFHGG